MALQATTPNGRILTGYPLSNRLVQARNIGGAQGLGQLLVDLDGRQFADFLDVDREDGLLARQLGIRVLGREGDLDIAVIARPGADQLVLEAGDEGACAKLQMVA